MRNLVASAVMIALSSASASAQSSSAEAETLFKQARELMAQKKYAEACEAFASSQKLDPTATTMYSLAVCRELEGKLATAWGVWVDFVRQHRSSSDASVTELVGKAKERAAKLEPRLSTLTISVPAASRANDLAIERDGTTIDRGAWDRPLPVDGGDHTIAVRRPGFQAWTTTVTTRSEGEAQTVTVPVLEPAPVPVTPPESTKPTVADPIDTPPPAKRSLVMPIAFAGGAVVLGGAALGFELWGRSMHDDAQATLDGGNEARANELQDGANLRRYLAQGFAVAAVGCAAVSIVMFVRGGGTEPRDRSAVRIVPMASGDHAGLAIGGAW